MNKSEDFFDNKKRIGKYEGQFNIEVGSYAFKDLFSNIKNNEKFIQKLISKVSSKNFVTVITHFEIAQDQRNKGLGNKMLNHVISESNFSTVFLIKLENDWTQSWLESKGFIHIPIESSTIAAFVRNKR